MNQLADGEGPGWVGLAEKSCHCVNEELDVLRAASMMEYPEAVKPLHKVASDVPSDPVELASIEPTMSTVVFKDCVFKDALDERVSVYIDVAVSKNLPIHFHDCTFHSSRDDKSMDDDCRESTEPGL